MIRAVHIRSSAYHYGPERSLLEIAPALIEHGVEPRIIIMYRRQFQGPPNHDLVAGAKRKGIPIEQIDDRGPLSTIALRRAIWATRGADVLHSHGYKSNLVAYIAATRAERRRPWVATMHLHTGTSARLRAYRALDRLVLRRADAVFTVSETQIGELVGHGIPSSRLETVPTVLDAKAYERAAVDRSVARAALGIDSEAPVIVAIGRLTRQKGFDVLIRSTPAILEAVPGARVIIAGDGPERRALDKLIDEHDLAENVQCIGYVDGVSGLLGAADAVVAPSRDEGLPLLLLEALARSRAVVATPVGGVPSVIEDGVTGRIVPVGDEAALATAIVDMLLDRAAAERLGAAGRERVIQRHSPSAVARMIAERYRALLGSTSNPADHV